MRENRYQRELIRRIESMFPGCLVLRNDPNYIQGLPDILILYKSTWAALEIKRSKSEPSQPNQEFYVSMLNDMAYASFIYPEIEDRVLDEIQYAFGFIR